MEYRALVTLEEVLEVPYYSIAVLLLDLELSKQMEEMEEIMLEEEVEEEWLSTLAPKLLAEPFLLTLEVVINMEELELFITMIGDLTNSPYGSTTGVEQTIHNQLQLRT